jgi:ferritin
MMLFSYDMSHPGTAEFLRRRAAEDAKRVAELIKWRNEQPSYHEYIKQTRCFADDEV